MESTLRLGVQELIRVYENLERLDRVLTVSECEAILRCAEQLEKKVLVI